VKQKWTFWVTTMSGDLESELNGSLETMNITDRTLEPETVILNWLPV
jgi:uncharacterized protein with ParB-like and HNH nuclease domain